MLEPFEFKGVTLQPGDTISIAATTIPLPCVQAAVVGQDPVTGHLELMSTMLAIFQHSGRFREAEVTDIMVEVPAREAVPLEARTELAWGQRACVRTQDSGSVYATVVAAFDGWVTGTTDDGQSITGGSLVWKAA